jgi:hypothetical protein
MDVHPASFLLARLFASGISLLCSEDVRLFPLSPPTGQAKDGSSASAIRSRSLLLSNSANTLRFDRLFAGAWKYRHADNVRNWIRAFRNFLE